MPYRARGGRGGKIQQRRGLVYYRAGWAVRWDGARELWLGVLAQAMTDAGMPAAGCNRSYPVEAVTGARRWLAGIGTPWTLALALSAADIADDVWFGRALPRLRARWRAADLGSAPVERRGRRPREARQDAFRPPGAVQVPAAGIGAPGAT
jgi:hypothetical protein